MNGDGKPDLAVANQGAATVSVLLNNGDGMFAPGAGYPAGDGPISVAAADVNGDGKPDLAIANETANTVSVLLNICLVNPLRSAAKQSMDKIGRKAGRMTRFYRTRALTRSAT